MEFVQTPVLNIGYGDYGNTTGFPIILLHGFPYDVRSWDRVIPLLVEAGYRVLVPYSGDTALPAFVMLYPPEWQSKPPCGGIQAGHTEGVTGWLTGLGVTNPCLSGGASAVSD